MTSKEASDTIANTGYNFHINLPDWSSQNNNSPSAEDIAKEKERRQENQIKIGFAVLAFIVLAIILTNKRKSK